MKRMLCVLLALLPLLCVQASASELTAPTVGEDIMPESTESFPDGLRELLQNALSALRPDLAEAAKAVVAVLAAAMIATLLHSASDGIRPTVRLAVCGSIAATLFLSAHSLIQLAGETVQSISEYGKLLLPVMTAAMAAQGSYTASSALYVGTAAFDAVLSGIYTGLILPAVYLFLAIAVVHSLLPEHGIKQLKELLNKAVTWFLKTSLTLFVSYMGLTNVISGATDAAMLKTTKAAISSAVPVVGSILSNASEAVLVSVSMAKNAAGLYGIFAVLSLFLSPFLRIGCHYLLLKLAAIVCSLMQEKEVSELVSDFSGAMGLLLGVIASGCVLQLVSTVCFMKGVS